ncbi:MAG: toll/interleukin-1 receptor domain-containing protein [Caldilineaceae bacterium]
MAKEKHVAILKEGAGVWNKWKVENPVWPADFSNADLRFLDLSGADLTNAHLDGADLSGADLSHVNLSYTELSFAKLYDTKLMGTILNDAYLYNTDFTSAKMGYAVLGKLDLRGAKGLEKVRHNSPSTIGIDTIYASKGKISESFLRGAGVDDTFIALVKSLIDAEGGAIQYYSCFISYSSADEELANRIYADLQSNNVRCWYAPEDMKIGDKIRQGIDHAIRIHDKLLLLLSEQSVNSQWVESEVESALEQERRHNKLVLFPIRLDDTVMDTDMAWAADVRRQRHLGDFTQWKDHDSYRKAFDRLLRDLKEEKQST